MNTRRTRDIGRFFWVPLHVEPRTPFLSVNPTWEETGKQWSPTLVIRIPLTRWAVGFGWWQDVDPDTIVTIHEADAEYAMYCAINGNVPRARWEEARIEVAALGLSPEEEMAEMQERGIHA